MNSLREVEISSAAVCGALERDGDGAASQGFHSSQPFSSLCGSREAPVLVSEFSERTLLRIDDEDLI